jgi:hypothetical protein
MSTGPAPFHCPPVSHEDPASHPQSTDWQGMQICIPSKGSSPTANLTPRPQPVPLATLNRTMMPQTMYLLCNSHLVAQ